MISAGVTVEPRNTVFGSIRVRHFGPRPLIEDASVKSDEHDAVEWRDRVSRVQQARLVLELFNIFDAEVSDIDYFYASRLTGEPAEGVEDVHTHPALPARFVSACSGRSRRSEVRPRRSQRIPGTIATVTTNTTART